MKYSEVREDFHSPYMSQVAERLSVLKLTSEERDFYYQEKHAALKARDYLTSAEAKGIEEGEKKGLKKGRQEGEKKGIEKGIEKGKAEGIQQGLEKTAKQMLSKGLDMQLICEMTGLSEAEVKRLQEGNVSRK